MTRDQSKSSIGVPSRGSNQTARPCETRNTGVMSCSVKVKPLLLQRSNACLDVPKWARQWRPYWPIFASDPQIARRKIRQNGFDYHGFSGPGSPIGPWWWQSAAARTRRKKKAVASTMEGRPALTAMLSGGRPYRRTPRLRRVRDQAVIGPRGTGLGWIVARRTKAAASPARRAGNRVDARRAVIATDRRRSVREGA